MEGKGKGETGKGKRRGWRRILFHSSLLLYGMYEKSTFYVSEMPRTSASSMPLWTIAATTPYCRARRSTGTRVKNCGIFGCCCTSGCTATPAVLRHPRCCPIRARVPMSPGGIMKWKCGGASLMYNAWNGKYILTVGITPRVAALWNPVCVHFNIRNRSLKGSRSRGTVAPPPLRARPKATIPTSCNLPR